MSLNTVDNVTKLLVEPDVIIHHEKKEFIQFALGIFLVYFGTILLLNDIERYHT